MVTTGGTVVLLVLILAAAGASLAVSLSTARVVAQGPTRGDIVRHTASLVAVGADLRTIREQQAGLVRNAQQAAQQAWDAAGHHEANAAELTHALDRLTLALNDLDVQAGRVKGATNSAITSADRRMQRLLDQAEAVIMGLIEATEVKLGVEMAETD